MKCPPVEGAVGAHEEFAGVLLGDVRRTRRAIALCEVLERAPSASFPKLLRDDCDLEAAYRFFQNKDVTARALIAGHIAATARRVVESGALALVVHDTSELRYFGERLGLGALKNGQGYLLHPALAVSPQSRAPLGLLSFETVIPKPPRDDLSKSEREAIRRATPRAERPCSRWENGVEAAEKNAAPGSTLLHVMDQECDVFALFWFLLERKRRCIIRGKPSRTLNGRDGETVRERLSKAKLRLKREVPLAKRPEKQKGRTQARRPCHPTRGARMAKLSVRVGRVQLSRPKDSQAEARELEMNVVYVYEPRPPTAEERVEWVLYTTEPIDTPEQVEFIIDGYRARWTIEEFFKALKTGCAIEKRQLTTQQGLERALALFCPIAWKLLALRTSARSEENAKRPASEVFDATTLAVLGELISPFKKLRSPTLRDAYLAIARVGGHLKRNGDPGWQSLGEGYVEVVKSVAIWRSAVAAVSSPSRSDQS